MEEMVFQATADGNLAEGTSACQETLDELGSEGWEAVAAWPAPAPNPQNKFCVLFKQADPE